MNKSAPNKPVDDPKAKIGVLRDTIDEIDEKILDLINQRLLLAAQIGAFKKQSGVQITDSEREKEVMNRLLEKNRGPLVANSLRHIFEAIIAEGRNVQRTD